MKRILEITGSPGVGKTTFIQKKYSSYEVIAGFSPTHYGSLRRFLASLNSFLKVFLQNRLSSRQLVWIVKQAWLYDETLYSRFNALRNCLLKFSVDQKHKNEKVIIDEGISHIPFIFQLGEREIQEFVVLFREILQERKLIFLTAPSYEVLSKRLANRGHSRVTSQDKLDHLVKTNIRVSKQYRETMFKENLNVTFIDNEAFD